MSVNCDICLQGLGFNTVYNLLRINIQLYHNCVCVWLPAKFSGIIAGLNILAYLKRHQDNLKRSQETCLFHCK